MKSINIFSIKFLLILAVALMAMSCGKSDSTEEEAEEHHEEETNTVEFTEGQFKNAGLKLSTIERKQISGTIRVNGVLDVPPQQLISISAPMGGFLRDTELLQGSRVKKGQVIARIENLDFIQVQQDYLEAKSQFDLAEIDYKRQQDLAQQNVNSAKVLQQAKTTFVSWQAKYKGLGEKLRVLGINAASLEEGNVRSSINLTAPISGYVTQVNANVGKFVSPTDVIFEIVDTEHLHAELIVFEKDVRKLRIGQKVRFTLANETSERLATVYLIGREISPERTVQIHCHIDKEDKELLPGMYLKAAVETGGAEVNALPDDAIIDFQGKKYIFVKTEEKANANQAEEKEHKHVEGDEKADEEAAEDKSAYHFTMIEIQIGNSELGYTEVTLPENLTSNTQIVVTGAYAILSKMKNSEGEGDHH